MKNHTLISFRFSHLLAGLLTALFLMPAALQAYTHCMQMDSAHHAEQAQCDGPCCEEPVTHHDSAEACESMAICACNDHALAVDREWVVPPSQDAVPQRSEIILPDNEPSARFKIPVLPPPIESAAPPLWLMYDTLLI
ncbi:MAG: hypothetical protein ACNA78_10040 [Balneolaceae bacterium]